MPLDLSDKETATMLRELDRIIDGRPLRDAGEVFKLRNLAGRASLDQSPAQQTMIGDDQGGPRPKGADLCNGTPDLGCRLAGQPKHIGNREGPGADDQRPDRVIG